MTKLWTFMPFEKLKKTEEVETVSAVTAEAVP